MKKIIITLILLIMGTIPIYYFLRWSDFVTSGTLEVNNITKDTILIGRSKSIAKGSLGITLHFQGEVDDSINIYGFTAKGKIDTLFTESEFYADTIRIDYTANNAKKGYLKIKYKFHVY